MHVESKRQKWKDEKYIMSNAARVIYSSVSASTWSYEEGERERERGVCAEVGWGGLAGTAWAVDHREKLVVVTFCQAGARPDRPYAV